MWLNRLVVKINVSGLKSSTKYANIHQVRWIKPCVVRKFGAFKERIREDQRSNNWRDLVWLDFSQERKNFNLKNFNFKNCCVQNSKYQLISWLRELVIIKRRRERQSRSFSDAQNPWWNILRCGYRTGRSNVTVSSTKDTCTKFN